MRNMKRKAVMRKMKKHAVKTMCKVLLGAAELLVAIVERLLAIIDHGTVDEGPIPMAELAPAVEEGPLIIPVPGEPASVNLQDSASTNGTDGNDNGSELPMVERVKFNYIQHIYPTLRHKKRAEAVNRLRAKYGQPPALEPVKNLV